MALRATVSRRTSGPVPTKEHPHDAEAPAATRPRTRPRLADPHRSAAGGGRPARRPPSRRDGETASAGSAPRCRLDRRPGLRGRRRAGRGLARLDRRPTPGRPHTGDDRHDRRPRTPTRLRPVEGAYFAELPVTSIVPNPRQPRQVFDEDAMAELVHSVREIGLLQPIVVRSAGEDRYELIMGERRWRATQAGRPRGRSRPSCARPATTSCCATRCWRTCTARELNPLEEAAAYQQLLDDFGCTHDELATRIGRSRPQISNTLRLLKLSPAVQRRVAAGVLSAGHARALLGRRGPGGAGPAGGPRGGRGHLGARPGGDRRGRRPRLRPGRDGPAQPPDRPGARPTSPPGSRTVWRPGSRSTSASARAGSPWSSPRCPTSSGSSA